MGICSHFNYKFVNNMGKCSHFNYKLGITWEYYKQVPISKSAIAKLQSFSNDTSQIKKVAPTQITQINQDEYVASNINASKHVIQTRKIK